MELILAFLGGFFLAGGIAFFVGRTLHGEAMSAMQSRFGEMLKAEKVVAINWGFVSGKTNTIFAWDQPIPDGKEPKVWFHDIFRQDGTPFSQEEIDTIKSLTGK